MGELWLARTTGAAGWEKLVAIKTILPHLTDQPEFIERFIDEARIATTLTHGNIVPVFDMGHADGRYFIAMEYVDGWDLRTLLRRVATSDTRVPDELAVYIASEVCRGLDFAHTRADEQGRPQGIVHRDISPANILLSRDGEVRIVDFGIASAERRLNQTITGELRGKFAYMSPEQAAGEALDGRSDLYSLGIVLYEMLTGAKPFAGENDLAVLKQVQRGAYRPLTEFRSDLDPMLRRVVEKTLARDPADRFSDASAMQSALLNILYQDTGPVSARQLAAFCSRFDRPRYTTGDIPSASFDALLAAQLEEAEATGSGTPTPSSDTSGALPGGSSAVVPPGQTPSRLPTTADNTGSEATRTVRVPAVGTRRQSRLRLAVFIAIVLIIALIAALAFQAGSRQSTQAPVVRIDTEPDGALVYFDGVSYGRSTVVARLQPGTWLVRAERAGYLPVETSINYDGQSDLDLDFELRPIPAPESAALGVQQIADVGEDAGREPAENAPEGETSDPSNAQTEDGADEQRERVRAREPQVTMTSLRLVGLPDGARISLNGEAQGQERTFRVPRNRTLQLLIEASGYQPLAMEHRPSGASQDLEVDLEPIAQGTLTIRFIGEVLRGEVRVDGRSYGENDLSSRQELELSVGEHRVVVRNEALGLEYEEVVEINESESTVLNVDWRLPEGR